MDVNDKSGEYERPAHIPEQPAIADGSGKSISACGTVLLMMIALCVLAIGACVVGFFWRR